MSIHKRTAGKQSKYDVKLRRPDGSQYQKSFNTKKQAEAYEAQQLVEHNSGTWLDDRYTNITFEQMSNRWLESNNAKRETSRIRDISILTKHLIPVIGNRQIKTIKRSDISAMVNTWVTAKLSPATIRRHVALSEPYPDAPCNYYHRESGGRYPALPAAQGTTTPMLATPAKTTPMLATSNYYRASLNKVEAKKKPAPNAEAPEAGHGPKAAGVSQCTQRTETEHGYQHYEYAHWLCGTQETYHPLHDNHKEFLPA